MSTQGNKLTAIADAIREKDGTTAPIVADDFPNRIRAIETGVDTSDATATENDILLDKTAYVDGEKVTGTIPTVEQATPSISIASNGLITASATQAGGFVASGEKSATKQLLVAGGSGKTIRPTTTLQKIAGTNEYVNNSIYVEGDSNLVASNIKQGVTIFGITGTVSPGVDTSDATATAAMIRSGYTAYVKGQKITGTVPTQSGSTIYPGTATVTAVPSGRITTGNVNVVGDANLKAENIKSGVSIFGVAGTVDAYYYTGIGNYTYSISNHTSSEITCITFDNTGKETRGSIRANYSISRTVAIKPFIIFLSQYGTISNITVNYGPNIATLFSASNYRIVYPTSEGAGSFSVN